MILHLYANFNRLGGFYTSIVSENIEPDVLAKDYIQIVSNFDEDTLKKLSECDLYHLGSFDNVTGVITPANDFLLHISEVTDRLLKKGEKVNGECEKN